MPDQVGGDHYKTLTPEPFEVIDGWGLSFRAASALKYIARYGRKPGVDPAEDLRKAAHYLLSEADVLERTRRFRDGVELRAVPDAPGYFASSSGRIYGPKGWLRCGVANTGYRVFSAVKATGASKRGPYGVHVAVARAWIGPDPGPQYQVRHLDGDKLNNTVSNLAWGTATDQRADDRRNGVGIAVTRSAATSCKRGHEFTPENTRIRARNGKTYRSCRKCQKGAHD